MFSRGRGGVESQVHGDGRCTRNPPWKGEETAEKEFIRNFKKIGEKESQKRKMEKMLPEKGLGT